MSFFGKKYPNVVELKPSDFDLSSSPVRIKKCNSNSMIMIYFSYCGYCHQVKPAFLELAKKLGKVYAFQGDKESHRAVIEKLQVMSAPDIRFVSSVGLVDKEKYMGERTVSEFAKYVASKGKKGGARKKRVVRKKSASKKKKRVVRKKAASKKKAQKGGAKKKRVVRKKKSPSKKRKVSKKKRVVRRKK